MEWIKKAYKDLSLDELYQILQLRLEVFVIEQTCFYQDIDGADADCHHLMGMKDGKLVAYARIVRPELHYKEPSIGRVITAKSQRKSGIGRLLMKQAMAFCEQEYMELGIRISAQKYLETFYQSLGFKVVSDVYLEDGIEHIEMLKSAKK